MKKKLFNLISILIVSVTPLFALKGEPMLETACLLSLNSATINKLIPNYVGNRLTSFAYRKQNFLHIFLLIDDGKDELTLKYKRIYSNNDTKKYDFLLSQIYNSKWNNMVLHRKDNINLQVGENYYATTDIKLIGPTTIVEGTDVEPFFIGTRWAGDSMIFSGTRIDRNSPLLKLIIWIDDLININK